MKCTIQHKVTDRWECLQDYNDLEYALERAKDLSKDHVTYGLVRVVAGRRSIATFSRGKRV